MLTGRKDRKLQDQRPSALLVFPVSGFSFRQPFECGCYTALASFFGLGLGNPLDIFLFVAVWETVEGGLGFFVLLETGGEVVGNNEFFLWRCRFRPNRPHAPIEQVCGLLDVAGDELLRRQIFQGGEATELSHGLRGFVVVWVKHHAAVPETERTVLLE